MFIEQTYIKSILYCFKKNYKIVHKSNFEDFAYFGNI